MKLGELLLKFHLQRVRLKLPAMQLEMSFEETDKDAAWNLYVELLTRITTQPLASGTGDEAAALQSVYAVVGATREILREHGRNSIQFSKVAVPVLNQVIRPFTSKWHRRSLAGAFQNDEECREFRTELEALQVDLRNYNRLLAEIAGVEDLTDLEGAEEE